MILHTPGYGQGYMGTSDLLLCNHFLPAPLSYTALIEDVLRVTTDMCNERIVIHLPLRRSETMPTLTDALERDPTDLSMQLGNGMLVENSAILFCSLHRSE